MDVKIKVEKFLMKQGVRVGKAAIEFRGENMGPLNGFHLVGFTICYDPSKGDSGQKYVMFPMAKSDYNNSNPKEGYSPRNFHFLRPDNPELLEDLQTAILDVYDSICENEFRNTPRVKQSELKL